MLTSWVSLLQRMTLRRLLPQVHHPSSERYSHVGQETLLEHEDKDVRVMATNKINSPVLASLGSTQSACVSYFFKGSL